MSRYKYWPEQTPAGCGEIRGDFVIEIASEEDGESFLCTVDYVEREEEGIEIEAIWSETGRSIAEHRLTARVREEIEAQAIREAASRRRLLMQEARIARAHWREMERLAGEP